MAKASRFTADSVFSAALPAPPPPAPPLQSPYARNQDGGNFGGAIVKDKLFFFLDAEHINQNLSAPVVPSDPFSSFTGNSSAPFRETDYDATARLGLRQRHPHVLPLQLF